MPRLGDIEFGLDYGPAPLDKEKAKAAYEKKGRDVTPEKLDFVGGTGPMPPNMEQMFGGQDPQEREAANKARLKQIANEQAFKLLNTKPIAFEETPRGFIKDMVVTHGKTMGEALSIINELYSGGNEYVKSLPGIDEFIAHTPGTLSMSMDKFSESIGEPLQRGGAALNTLSKAAGGPNLFRGPTSEEIDFRKKFKEETRPANLTSDLVGSLPGMAAMMAIENAVYPAAAAGAIRLGGPATRKALKLAGEESGFLTKELIDAVGKDRLARWIGRGASITASMLGYDYMYNESMTSGQLIGAGVGAYALTKIANKIGGVKLLDKGFEFLSAASGRPAEEIAAKVLTGQQMLHALSEANAPPEFVNRFIISGSKTYGKTFGNYVGRWASKVGKTPEEFQALISNISDKKFIAAANQGYEATNRFFLLGVGRKAASIENTGNILRQLGADDGFMESISKNQQTFNEGAAKFIGRKVAQVGESPELLAEIMGTSRPKYHKLAIDEYNNFFDEMGFAGQAIHPKLRWEAMQHFRGPAKKATDSIDYLVSNVPIEVGGATKYYPILSKWHLNNVGKGLTETRVMRFKNPLYIDYKSNQIPAYAAIARFQGSPKITAAVLQRIDNGLANINSIDLSQSNNIIEGLANRMAKRFGYDSIIYRGETPDRFMFVDLDKTAPLEDSANKIIEKMEKSLQSAGKRAVGKNFLSIAAPALIGLGALTQTDEAKGMSLPKGIGEAAGKVVKKALPRRFSTLINDLGEQLFSHETGAQMHWEMLGKLGWKNAEPQDVTKAVLKGWVRAGRDSEGPFAEFNWDNEAARNRAYDFIKSTHEPGDMVILDVHKKGEGLISKVIPSIDDALSLIKTGELPVRVSRIRDFLGIAIPVGVGLGALTTPDDSEAMSMEPFVKAASKFKSIKAMAESLEPKLAALVKQAAAISGETSPKGVVEYLSKIHSDVHGLKGGAQLELFDRGPNYVGATVSHSDLPFPLVTIHGVVDPDSGTWYPQIRNSPLGFGKEGMGKVFEKVKKQGLVSKISNPKNLAGMILATAAAVPILDMFTPNKAEAAEFPTKPIVDLLSKGVRGAGDDVLEDIARSKSVDDLMRVAYDNVRKVAKGLTKKDFTGMDVGDEQFIKFDTWGKLTPESQQELGMGDTMEGMNTLYRIRTPGNATDHPYWQSYYANFVRKKDVMITSDDSTVMRLRKQAEDILNPNKIHFDTKEKMDDFYRALHGFRPMKNGGSLQTQPNISSGINAAAKRVHDEILAPLWQFNTGVDPKAVGIMHELGLEQTRANWELIKRIQLKEYNEPMPQGADAKHISAATQMSNMINPKPWQWRNLEVPYEDAKILIRPIDQERAELNRLIQAYNTQYGPNPPQDVAIRKAMLTKRLNFLNEKERRGIVGLPKMDVLHQHNFQPFDEPLTGTPKEIPFETQEKDPFKLLYRHIDGSVSKAFFDEQNAYAKVITDYFDNARDEHGLQPESRAVSDYIREFMNTVNGIKSLRGDARLAQTINSVLRGIGTDKRVGIDQIRRAANNILEFTYLSKLGFGLRFPIINVTQPLQTTAMITGYGPLARAYAKVMNDRAIWDEARRAGLILRGTGRAMSDIEKLGNDAGPVRTLMDWLPSKSEELNRVVSYQAGKDWVYEQLAKTGSVKVPHFVRTLDRKVLASGDAERIAKEVGAAIAKTTQFIFGPEGRPVVLSGGAARRVAFQFKSFTAGYIDLLVGAAEHFRRTGDFMPLTRGLTSLVLLGGLGTILPYEMIRTQLIKRGVKWAGKLPGENESGLGYLISTAASTFAQPETKEQLDQALSNLQLTGSYSAINLPGLGGENFYKGMAQFVGGPTIGPVMAAGGESLMGYAQGNLSGDKAFQSALRALAPGIGGVIPGANIPFPGASGLEALQMLGNKRINKMLSDLGYRGGIYSPTGKLLARQQPMLGVISRAFNLQPSLRSQRYRYMRDIQSALEGGQPALAQQFLADATKRGFIIDKEDLGHLKGAATRKQHEKSKPNEPLR